MSCSLFYLEKKSQGKWCLQLGIYCLPIPFPPPEARDESGLSYLYRTMPKLTYAMFQSSYNLRRESRGPLAASYLKATFSVSLKRCNNRVLWISKPTPSVNTSLSDDSVLFPSPSSHFQHLEGLLVFPSTHLTPGLALWTIGWSLHPPSSPTNLAHPASQLQHHIPWSWKDNIPLLHGALAQGGCAAVNSWLVLKL